jgi:HSP20 family molecular chaperone IbpA
MRDVFDSIVTDLYKDYIGGLYNHNQTNSSLKNKEDATVLSLDLPGFKRSEIKVIATKNNLKISVDGTRGKKSYVYTLRDIADYKSITSKFEDGVLTITIPFKKNTDDSVEVSVE